MSTEQRTRKWILHSFCYPKSCGKVSGGISSNDAQLGKFKFEEEDNNQKKDDQKRSSFLMSGYQFDESRQTSLISAYRSYSGLISRVRVLVNSSLIGESMISAVPSGFILLRRGHIIILHKIQWPSLYFIEHSAKILTYDSDAKKLRSSKKKDDNH